MADAKYTHTPQSKLELFFAQAGKLKRQWVETTGTAPHRRHVACFEYQHGMAKHDGEGWVFELTRAVEGVAQ